jgi:hypothetical protein
LIIAAESSICQEMEALMCLSTNGKTSWQKDYIYKGKWRNNISEEGKGIR